MKTVSHFLTTHVFWMLLIGTTPWASIIMKTLLNATAISLEGDLVTPMRILSMTSSRERPLLPHTSAEHGALPRRELRSDKGGLPFDDDLPISSLIRQRTQTEDENRNITKALTNFLLGESTGRNIFIFYDQHLYSGIAEAVGLCFQQRAEVTLLTCDDVPARLGNILKSYNQLRSLRNILVFCSSDLTRMIFQEIFDKYLESAQTHWFVVTAEDITSGIVPLLREGTQVSFAVKESTSTYQLMISYVNISNKITLRNIGWWSWEVERGTKYSLEAPLARPLCEIYRDFGGRELRATVINNWPFWVLEFLQDGTIHPVSGLDFHVLTDISQKLNFTFRMINTPDRLWGGVLANGSITGMIGAVHYHAAHLAINEVSHTEMREEAIDFTYPYFHESVTLISAAPKKRLKTYAVFTSFTYEVWILLVLVTLAAGPVLCLILWLRKVLFGETYEKWEDLGYIIFTLFKTMTVQVAAVPPQGVAIRMFFMGWYFFCFLIIYLYADVMMSHLAVPSYEKPIDSLWDLLDAIEHRGFVTLISCGSNNEYLFSTTDYKIYKDIWTRFDRQKGCILTWDEGMDKVTTGKFALVNNHMGAEVRANLRGRERFHFAKTEFYPHGYSIACPNGSPYRNAFKKVLQPLMWSGLVQKYTNDELMKARDHTVQGEPGPAAISIVHLQASFYLLLAGYVVGIASLVVETFVRFHRGTSVKRLSASDVYKT